MTNVTRIKTEAEQAITAQVESLSTAAGSVLRSAGHAVLQAGLPHRRVEAYKYTDLKALIRHIAPLAGPASPSVLAAIPHVEPSATSLRLVIVDGVYRADLSDTALIPAGVTVTSLQAALAAGKTETIALLAGPAIAGGDPALALNAALMSDGVVIEVADGTDVARIITIAHFITSPTPVSTHTRSAVIVGDGSSLGLIETIETGVAGHQQTSVLNVRVGNGATLEHAIAKADASSLDLATQTVILGADASFRSFALVTAGEVTRRQHFVRFEGDRSMLSLRGASLLKGSMHADTTLVVEHDSLHCESRELFRHVIDGDAHGVFQGKVIVRPDAQKTDGKMASNALLLSGSAEMDNKPELEIYADDVACGHGATCGEIDESPIFYLMSRGLPRAVAEALLIQSFVGEVVDSVGDGPLGRDGEALRDTLIAAIEAWLGQRAIEGKTS